MKLKQCAAAIVAACAVAAHAASPFRMDYCVVDQSGLYQYTFTITLDNSTGTWTPGYGIGWIVFGDVPSGFSPINDFVADPTSLPVGEWTRVERTGGGHNGPNLAPVVVQVQPFPPIHWVPSAVGESITWRGTSATSLPAGELKWSALFAVNGPTVSFETAQLVTCGTPCGSADFDCDGDTATDADIESFFACLAGTCPSAPCASTADFDGDGDTATDADIEAFFRVLAGGDC